jgi:hypothetical protein
MAVRTAKTPPERGFPMIGAPRFELGTSSPPDCSSGQAGGPGTWREVAAEQGLYASDPSLGGFLPRRVFGRFVSGGCPRAGAGGGS